MKKKILMAKAYNPTNKTVEFMTAGYLCRLEPGEMEDLHDDYLRIIMKPRHKSRKMGVVVLQYDEKQEQLYGSFEAYREAKAEEGLNNLYGTAKQNYVNERQALRDIGESSKKGNVSVFEEDLIKPENFKKELENAEEQLKKVKQSRKEKGEVKRKPGRPKASESTTDQGQD